MEALSFAVEYPLKRREPVVGSSDKLRFVSAWALKTRDGAANSCHLRDVRSRLTLHRRAIRVDAARERDYAFRSFDRVRRRRQSTLVQPLLSKGGEHHGATSISAECASAHPALPVDMAIHSTIGYK